MNPADMRKNRRETRREPNAARFRSACPAIRAAGPGDRPAHRQAIWMTRKISRRKFSSGSTSTWIKSARCRIWSGWLYRVTVNACVDLRRRHPRRCGRRTVRRFRQRRARSAAGGRRGRAAAGARNEPAYPLRRRSGPRWVLRDLEGLSTGRGRRSARDPARPRSVRRFPRRASRSRDLWKATSRRRA